MRRRGSVHMLAERGITVDAATEQPYRKRSRGADAELGNVNIHVSAGKGGLFPVVCFHE